MLTEVYIEALLVDPDLADQVWDAWDGGRISDNLAAIAWCILSLSEIEPHSTGRDYREVHALDIRHTD